MRKFNEVYKEKMQISETLQENKVLEDFRKVYNALLEHYSLKSIHDLDDKGQLSLLTELNHYWSEDEGLSEKGQMFLQKRSLSLNENSTIAQRKNFLKTKATVVINETLRQSNIKHKLYDVLDQMYNQINASDISDVLSADMIKSIIQESFIDVLEKVVTNIHTELKESSTPKKKYVVKVKKS